jgi:glutamate---cysteine ligase / carboxylate-amine ligase
VNDRPPPTIGIEEEYFLLDPETRAPVPAGARVVAEAASGEQICGEFSQFQIEAKTSPCDDAQKIRDELVRLRADAARAAAVEGLHICASGTPVIGAEPATSAVGDHPRYRAGLAQYRAMLDDFAVCSMHTHVHLPDRDVALLVGNHLRPWLPLLVAMSANSPFHQGRDTGYAAWRAVIRLRFPCLGPPPYAESSDHQWKLAVALARSEAMLEPGMPFWDIRCNPRLPTLEVRAMDVNADVEDAVAVAVLVRALVMTAETKVLAGQPGPLLSTELLRAAYWRGARDGWYGGGVDALTGEILPTCAQAERLVEFVLPSLEDCGDTDVVTSFLGRLVARGTGADRQRASAEHDGSLFRVVDDLLALTARG